MEKPYVLVREDMKRDIAEVINSYIGKVYVGDIREFLLKVASNMQEAENEEIKKIKEKYERESNREADADSKHAE